MKNFSLAIIIFTAVITSAFGNSNLEIVRCENMGPNPISPYMPYVLYSGVTIKKALLGKTLVSVKKLEDGNRWQGNGLNQKIIQKLRKALRLAPQENFDEVQFEYRSSACILDQRKKGLLHCSVYGHLRRDYEPRFRTKVTVLSKGQILNEKEIWVGIYSKINSVTSIEPRAFAPITRETEQVFSFQFADDHRSIYTGKPGIVNRDRFDFQTSLCR